MSLKKNVIANFVGQGWAALMAIAFVPVYIDYLGLEAYGLIGFFTMLQVWLSILDAGLSPTLGREMARYRGGLHNIVSIHGLLQSMQWVFLGISVIIVLITCSLSPWLSTNWLSFKSLDINTVQEALNISAIVIATRLFSGLYRSAILGLQNQVGLNLINIAFATLKGLGVVLALKYISPTVKTFFIYQAIISLIEAIILRQYLLHLIPKPQVKQKLSFGPLKEVKNFAGGMFAVTLLATFLTQADKLILSKLLPLSDFGKYALASLVASSVTIVFQPLSNAIRPKLAELVASDNVNEIAERYHNISQLYTILVVPVGTVMCIFSAHILLLWTRNWEITQDTSIYLSLLSIGYLLNGLMNAPYALQLAYGQTRYAVVSNFLGAVLLVPSLIIFINLFGTIAAPVIWILLNLGYFSITVPIMHKKLLKNEMHKWYWTDTLLPSIYTIIPLYLLYVITPKPALDKPLLSLFVIAASIVLSYSIVLSATGTGRKVIQSLIRTLKK